MAQESIDPHIGLTAASGIAYDQLAHKPRSFYDVEHFTEVLNQAGQTLIRLAPLYAADALTGDRRRVAEGELLDAQVTRGASVLLLADGSKLSRLTIARSDLRSAIQILRGTGVKAFPSARRGQKS